MPEKRTRKIEFLAAKSLPSFNDYRVKNDAVMVPDRGFVKQLKKLDPEFEVMWDWGSEKWEIWRYPRDGKEPCHILTVQTKVRSYRELGADVLLKLQETSWERFSAKQLADYLDELDNQVKRRKEKAFREKLKDIAWETFINIHCKIIQVPRKYKIGSVLHAD